MPRIMLTARVLAALLLAGRIALAQVALAQAPLDPGAWGSDHVGEPLPSFTSGDECLFCHRDVGPTWFKNRHGQAVSERPDNHVAISELARLPQSKIFVPDIHYLMGRTNRLRFLKPSTEHGRLDLLSVEWISAKHDAPGRLSNVDNPHWDTKTFGARCAGCH